MPDPDRFEALIPPQVGYGDDPGPWESARILEEVESSVPDEEPDWCLECNQHASGCRCGIPGFWGAP